MSKNKDQYRIFQYSAPVVLVFIWWALSKTIPNDLLPTPFIVAREAIVVFFSYSFFSNLLITLRRIVIGLSLSFIVSIVTGLFVYRSEFLYSLVKHQIFLGLLIPSTVMAFVIIILCGTREISPILTIVVTTTPQLFVIIISGLRMVNKELSDMGRVFHIGNRSELQHILLPQLVPALFAALRTGLSISWKTSMIAETFAFSSGVGYQIYFQFVMFSLKGVFAWTVAFLFVMGVIDACINRLERKTLVWKNVNE